MSWWLMALPLHRVPYDQLVSWSEQSGLSYGMPGREPEQRALPQVSEILAAFRDSGCHGSAWFRVGGGELVPGLDPCTEPGACWSSGGLDLGEVTLTAAEPGGDDLLMTTLIESLGFRKPAGIAVLHAIAALAETAGPILVFDDSADRFFVVSPGDQPGELAGHWPW